MPQEHEHDIYQIDWPMFMSAVERQKMLQDKVHRAAKYMAALESCTVTSSTRNFDVRQQVTGCV
jgi:hypothetical protein